MPVRSWLSKRSLVPVVAAAAATALFTGIGTAPAWAYGTSKQCLSGTRGCGEAYAITKYTSYFTYGITINDTNCAAASGTSYAKIRVWFTDGSSKYGSDTLYDPTCDGFGRIHEGWTVSTNTTGQVFDYYRVVTYDSQHTAGVLGNRVDF